MYDPPTALSLHRLSRHSLQDRYESDEEAVSESEAGAYDLLSSPVGSQRAGIFDSDLSADDISDRDDEHTLSAPPTVKRTRPVSSATTIKRNSTATFDEDTYVFDPEEQMVVELPDSPPELATSTFLQPPLCIWPKPPLSASVRSRSASPSSIFSIEEADIQVAKKITILEPHTRPTLVFINALGPRGKSSRSRQPSHSRSRESSRPRPAPTRADSRFSVPRSTETTSKPPRLAKQSTNQPSTTGSAQTSIQPRDENTNPAPGSATINRISEIPQVLYIPASPRTTPSPHAYNPAQPQTRAQEPQLQPQSQQQPTSPSPTPSSNYTYTTDPNPLTKTPSHTTSTTPHQHIRPETPSYYSVTNMLSTRSPLKMRRTTRKHSWSSVHSLTSLRSEGMGSGPSSSQLSIATQPGLGPCTETQTQTQMQMQMQMQNQMQTQSQNQPARKNSKRRHLRGDSIAPRGFMGKLGKRLQAKS
ncbi:hypothetical protein N7535_002805 [Penicillium sp. DV-2018c]|nr:hypothetical protein N7535_002805 [Penicillium sp. DV-2018c]